MRKTVLIAISSLVCTIIYAQEEFYSGLLLNDSAYAQIPQKPDLLTRNYEILPESYSLQAFCPEVKNQGRYGTCTGWATTYAARTIAEAIANNWQDPFLTTREAFSPLFVYTLIKNNKDVNCLSGTFMNLAFETLKGRGTVKYDDFDFYCPSSVPRALLSKATAYTIDNYFTLFSEKEPYEKKINTTKKSIAENRPVVISMLLFTSFYNTNEDVWSGFTDVKREYHAMCVVAYDDNKYGGAFLLMNSWGRHWGVDGFKWVRYDDYNQYVNYAIEMYVKKKDLPPAPIGQVTPRPTPGRPVLSKQSELVDLAGELRFILSTGQEMRPKLQSNRTTPYYKLEGSYISGTRYRLYISNNEPAYVYVIGSDLKNSVSKVFPPNDHISAALVYKSNDIAIPDEKWYIEMDHITGKDYICVLYSRDELPINDIVKNMKAKSGSFFDKVAKVLSDKTVPAKTIKYDTSTINFSVKNTNKIVVPIIVEIDHK